MEIGHTKTFSRVRISPNLLIFAFGIQAGAARKKNGDRAITRPKNLQNGKSYAFSGA